MTASSGTAPASPADDARVPIYFAAKTSTTHVRDAVIPSQHMGTLFKQSLYKLGTGEEKVRYSLPAGMFTLQAGKPLVLEVGAHPHGCPYEIVLCLWSNNFPVRVRSVLTPRLSHAAASIEEDTGSLIMRSITDIQFTVPEKKDPEHSFYRGYQSYATHPDRERYDVKFDFHSNLVSNFDSEPLKATLRLPVSEFPRTLFRLRLACSLIPDFGVECSHRSNSAVRYNLSSSTIQTPYGVTKDESRDFKNGSIFTMWIDLRSHLSLKRRLTIACEEGMHPITFFNLPEDIDTVIAVLPQNATITVVSLDIFHPKTHFRSTPNLVDSKSDPNKVNEKKSKSPTPDNDDESHSNSSDE